jgi:hypothetical protein
MKASELVSKLSALIEEQGDMEIFYDCDSLLAGIESVRVLGTPYFDPPVVVFSLPALEQAKYIE